VNVSWFGVLAAAIYLGFPLTQLFRVVARNSYGGLFSQEFALFVLTLPGAILAEKLFNGRNAVRMVAYVLSALVNAGLVYALGWGLEWLVRKL
jgi:hypothetical protein